MVLDLYCNQCCCYWVVESSLYVVCKVLPITVWCCGWPVICGRLTLEPNTSAIYTFCASISLNPLSTIFSSLCVAHLWTQLVPTDHFPWGNCRRVNSNTEVALSHFGHLGEHTFTYVANGETPAVRKLIIVSAISSHIMYLLCLQIMCIPITMGPSSLLLSSTWFIVMFRHMCDGDMKGTFSIAGDSMWHLRCLCVRK